MDSGALDCRTDFDVHTAWQQYQTTKSAQAREVLILSYIPLVKFVASRVSVGLPSNVDFDDLISFGMFGLLDALEKFDAERGVKFETYAVARIRGAIIDGLRSIDWVPRSIRQKAKELEKVVSRLESENGGPATDFEISQALSLSMEEYHQLLLEISGLSLASLDEVWAGDSEEEKNLRFGQMIENEASENPTHAVEDAEVKRILAEAIDFLPERERLVISLYYYEELTLKEIGHILEVSESRVSQIHTQALLRLRGKLGRLRESLVS